MIDVVTLATAHMFGDALAAQAHRLFPRDLEWLGEDAAIEGRMESAFRIPVASIAPQGARERYGFGSSVLCMDGRTQDIHGMEAA